MTNFMHTSIHKDMQPQEANHSQQQPALADHSRP